VKSMADAIKLQRQDRPQPLCLGLDADLAANLASQSALKQQVLALEQKRLALVEEEAQLRAKMAAEAAAVDPNELTFWFFALNPCFVEDVRAFAVDCDTAQLRDPHGVVAMHAKCREKFIGAVEAYAVSRGQAASELLVGLVQWQCRRTLQRLC